MKRTDLEGTTQGLVSPEEVLHAVLGCVVERCVVVVALAVAEVWVEVLPELRRALTD